MQNSFIACLKEKCDVITTNSLKNMFAIAINNWQTIEFYYELCGIEVNTIKSHNTRLH